MNMKIHGYVDTRLFIENSGGEMVEVPIAIDNSIKEKIELLKKQNKLKILDRDIEESDFD